jgi:hypothetical protein
MDEATATRVFYGSAYFREKRIFVPDNTPHVKRIIVDPAFVKLPGLATQPQKPNPEYLLWFQYIG